MKTDKPTEDDIKDHLETYSPILEEINKTEAYEPSVLFGWQDKAMGKISKWLNEDNDTLDGEEELKNIMIAVGTFVAVFSIVVLGIVIFK